MRRRRAIPFQPQLDAADCGAAALAMALRHHGLNASLEYVREQVRPVRGGVTARSIVDAARRFGLPAQGVRAPASSLNQLGTGTILFWRGNHYVVLESVARRSAVIADPSVGRRQVGLDELAECYSGIAIRFGRPDEGNTSRAPQTSRARTPSPWRTVSLFVPHDLRWLMVVGCSVVLVVATTLIPLAVSYLSLPHAIANRPTWAWTCIVGLAVLGMYGGASVIRNVAVARLQGVSDQRSTMTILRRVLGAPTSFTARRSSGDLIMRVRTSYVVREAVSGVAIAGVLDGLLILVYLAVLLAIDGFLASMVIGLVGLQLVISALAWRRQQLLNASAVDEQSRSQSELFELLQGIETIKSLGIESVVAERFERSLGKEISARVSARQNLGLAQAATSLMQFAAPLVVLGVGSARVDLGRVSLSVVFAFTAVALCVFPPLSSMIESILQVSTLHVHFARVADLMNARSEVGLTDEALGADALTGSIRFSEVTFEYLAGDPVLRDVHLDIRRGQVVIVSGDSGAGKSTLAMLMAGVVEATSGRVFLDDHDLGRLDKQAVRRRIGYVAQASHFFTGTLRENIDPGRQYSDERVREAARVAGIHELVSSLPMGYRTTFAPATFPLSGGQRQRLALARALVRRPPMLILDEATNALDLDAERRVIERIATLGCTVIIVSHRPYGQLTGDLRITVENGRVRQETLPGVAAAASTPIDELVEAAGGDRMP